MQLLFIRYLSYSYLLRMQARSLRYILAYDAYCGPCKRFAQIVDVLDKDEKIDFISLTEADQKGLLYKIPSRLRYKSFHLISNNGQVRSGSDALTELIRILPGGKVIFPLINDFPAGNWMVRILYNKISRLHDTGSCNTNNNNNNNNNNSSRNEMHTF